MAHLMGSLLALLAAPAALRLASAARDSSDAHGALAALDGEQDATGGSGQRRKRQDPETLLFLDVDGVLNVGIDDPTSPGSPILWDKRTAVSMAEEYSTEKKRKALVDDDERDQVERLRAVIARTPVGEADSFTYKNVSADEHLLVKLYIDRLVSIVKQAGDNVKIVLSSTWRKPAHEARRGKLEERLGKRLGHPRKRGRGSFHFELRTQLPEISDSRYSPGWARIVEVGNFVEQYCANNPSAGALRILMLDDLLAEAIGSWALRESPGQGAQAVEGYLRSRVPSSRQPRATAKLVQPVDEWLAVPWYKHEGATIRLMCGLTQRYLDEATGFLNTRSAEVWDC